MSHLMDTMIAFFEEDEWPYTIVEEGSVLGIVFQGQHGQWTCYAQAREPQQQFVFYSVCPVNAPQSKRNAMMAFLTRANYGLVIGNFEMDLEDGEIRYKTSIDVEGTELVAPLMKPVVYANVMMMDQYLPGIMSIIYSDVSPEQAIAQVEG
jgi:hypothetical protein